MRSILNAAFVVAVCIWLVLPSTSMKLIWFIIKLHKTGNYKFEVY
jgi:hypothetical protein